MRASRNRCPSVRIRVSKRNANLTNEPPYTRLRSITRVFCKVRVYLFLLFVLFVLFPSNLFASDRYGLSDFPIFSRYVQSSKLVRRNYRFFLWEFVKKNAHTRAIHRINERRKQKCRQYDAMKNTPDIRRIIDLLSELYLLCK